MLKDQEPKSQPLEVKVGHASLGRGIDFIATDLQHAKEIARKSMAAIMGQPNPGIEREIENLEVREGRGKLDWDYYGVHVLKTGLDFDELSDGRWTVGINKAFSEGSSLRRELEKVVGEPSIVSDASLEVTLPNGEQAKTYLERIGATPSQELLNKEARDDAYKQITYLVRDVCFPRAADRNEKPQDCDRPQQQGEVIATVAATSNIDTRKIILNTVVDVFEGVRTQKWASFRVDRGILDQVAEDETATAQTIQLLCSRIDELAKLYDSNNDKGLMKEYEGEDAVHPGSYSHFYLDMMQKTYDALPENDKAVLFQSTCNFVKGRLQEKGIEAPKTVGFGYDREDRIRTSELSINSSVALNSERLSASISQLWEGSFDIETMEFQPDGHPTSFWVHVSPSEEYRFSNIPEIQDLINVAISQLALQSPDYMDRKIGSAKADKSHLWAVDILSKALLSSDNEELKDMGTTLLEYKGNTGRTNPDLN